MFAEYLVFQPHSTGCVVLQAVFTSIKIIYYDNIPHFIFVSYGRFRLSTLAVLWQK